MSNENHVTNAGGVFYFETPENSALYKGNELKEFLLFIKSEKIRGPVKFSFSPEGWSLTNNLSMKESIILDSINTSLSGPHIVNFSEYMEGLKNPYLKELQERIGDLDKRPSNTDFRTRKLASLLKALVKQCPYLFLQNPEKYLRDSDLPLVTKILEKEIELGRTVFLSTGSFTAFKSIISKTVARGKQKEFIVNTVFQKPEPEQNVIDFQNVDPKKAA